MGFMFSGIIWREESYIGEARKQTLKDRITQSFTEYNTGGTFRDNYISKENCDFNAFMEFLSDKQIIIFKTEAGMIARALESLLILTLKPKYNKDI